MTLLVGQEDVRELLPMTECIEAMREVLSHLAHGRALQPLRPVMWLPDKAGALGMMPGHVGPLETMGIKTVTVFPGNAGTEYDSHQGTVMLFDSKNGRLLAIIDATEITAIRTAAVSAVATDALARNDSSVLAILGAGVQGRSHLAAIPLVRRISEVRVWSRDGEKASALAASVGEADARAVSSVSEAVRGADVVCTTTASPTPILLGDAIEPGMHVNAVGSSVPFARELDGAALARSRIFVDRRESTLNESGDFLIAREERAVTDADIVAELGDVIVGSHDGRTGSEETTLFISLGLAVEDIGAAHVVYNNAEAAGRGTHIDLGGRRHG